MPRPPIRDRFLQAVEDLSRTIPPRPSSCKVPKQASLSQCLGYTHRFVIAADKGKRRYRFDHFQDALKAALKAPDIKSRGFLSDPRGAVSADIGSGPGLCSWAVLDLCLKRGRPTPRFLAMDQAPNMIRLARELWQRMETGASLWCSSDPDEFVRFGCRAVRDRPLIVSFGHVLKQTLEDGADDNPAFTGFSRILVDLSRSARACLVVVADAHGSSEVRSAHQASWEVLQRRVEARSGRLVSMGKLDRSRQYGLLEVASS